MLLAPCPDSFLAPSKGNALIGHAPKEMGVEEMVGLLRLGFVVVEEDGEVEDMRGEAFSRFS